MLSVLGPIYKMKWGLFCPVCPGYESEGCFLSGGDNEKNLKTLSVLKGRQGRCWDYWWWQLCCERVECILGRGQWDMSYWEGKLLVILVAYAILGAAEWKMTEWRCRIAASVLRAPKYCSRIFCGGKIWNRTTKYS